MSQMDVYKMDGIKDLPVAVRLPFGKAWFAEYEGRTEDAADWLDKAVQAEAERK